MSKESPSVTKATESKSIAEKTKAKESRKHSSNEKRDKVCLLCSVQHVYTSLSPCQGH